MPGAAQFAYGRVQHELAKSVPDKAHLPGLPRLRGGIPILRQHTPPMLSRSAHGTRRCGGFGWPVPGRIRTSARPAPLQGRESARCGGRPRGPAPIQGREPLPASSSASIGSRWLNALEGVPPAVGRVPLSPPGHHRPGPARSPATPTLPVPRHPWQVAARLHCIPAARQPAAREAHAASISSP